MPQQINDGFDLNAPRGIDIKETKLVDNVSVPYASTSEALAAIDVAYRHEGRRFYVNDGTLKQYRFTSDYASDGIELVGGGSVSFPIVTDGVADIQYDDAAPAIRIDNDAEFDKGVHIYSKSGDIGDSFIKVLDTGQIYIRQITGPGITLATYGAILYITQTEMTIVLANDYPLIIDGLQEAADDAAAAALGTPVPVNGLYRNGSVLMIRVS